MMRLTWLLAAALAACGPSTAEIKTARESAYQTEFATVWNAVVAEMRERYPDDQIKVEDPVRGLIESKWKAEEARQDSTVGESNQRTNQTASSVKAHEMFRMMARVEPGGPPWRVSVEGEAALFRPEMTMLIPYKHGDIDEPSWVPGKIDALRLGIHQRLKQYAVQTPVAGAPATRPPAGAPEDAPPAPEAAPGGPVPTP